MQTGLEICGDLLVTLNFKSLFLCVYLFLISFYKVCKLGLESWGAYHLREPPKGWKFHAQTFHN